MIGKISSRGRVTIPKEIRERLGWEAGTEILVEDLGSHVVLRRATSLEELVGCAEYKGPRRSLGEMEAGVARGVRLRNREH